jgi:hypothetical protein
VNEIRVPHPYEEVISVFSFLHSLLKLDMAGSSSGLSVLSLPLFLSYRYSSLFLSLSFSLFFSLSLSLSLSLYSTMMGATVVGSSFFSLFLNVCCLLVSLFANLLLFALSIYDLLIEIR